MEKSTECINLLCSFSGNKRLLCSCVQAEGPLMQHLHADTQGSFFSDGQSQLKLIKCDAEHPKEAL